MTRSFLIWLNERWGFNSSRVYLERFILRGVQTVGQDALVLDAGAGDGRYRRFFHGVTYESADYSHMEGRTEPLTYHCDLKSIPVDSNRYDFVLFTQVLEHLSDPVEVLKEIHRVLKPGGRLWLSTPLFYEEHMAPNDFFRYTQFGLCNLVERAGLKVIDIDWLEGYYGTLAYELEMGSRCLLADPRAYGGGWRGLLAASLALMIRPTFLVLSFLFSRWDVRHKHKSTGHCKNYCLVAEKSV